MSAQMINQMLECNFISSFVEASIKLKNSISQSDLIFNFHSQPSINLS